MRLEQREIVSGVFSVCVLCLPLCPDGLCVGYWMVATVWVKTRPRLNAFNLLLNIAVGKWSGVSIVHILCFYIK